MKVKKKSQYALLLLTAPTCVVAIGAVVLMNLRISTPVKVDLVVNQLTFTVGGTERTPILNTVRFQSLSVRNFAHIDFSPAKLEVADPAQYALKEDRYPESAWKPVTVKLPVVITCENQRRQPQIALALQNPDTNVFGTLDPILAGPGDTVTISVEGNTSKLAVDINGHESRRSLSLDYPFILYTTSCHLGGIVSPVYEEDSLSFRVQLPAHNDQVEITSQPHSLTVNVAVEPRDIPNIFPTNGIEVTSLDFTRLDNDDYVTTLTGNGEIGYPEHPQIEKVRFEKSDFIGLRRFVEKFRINAIAMDPEHQGIRLRLIGTADYIKTGPRDHTKDRRLSYFDTLWKSSTLMILLTITGLVFPTTLGAYRLYKET